MVKILDTNNHIVRNIQSTFNVIGKTSHTKFLRAAHGVLLESVVRNSAQQRRLLSHTYHILKLNRKIVKKYSIIRENIHTPGGKKLFGFWIDVVKDLVQKILA